MGITLKVNGKPLEINPESPTGKRVKDFLDGLPADEIVGKQELARKLNINPRTLDKDRTKLPDMYAAIFRGKRYFGNPKAIAELRRQTA